MSLTIWGTAEGFGEPYGATSTDIGAAVMYTVVFLGLLALSYEGGPSRFSVDYLIEQRVSWWHRIAEVGHNGHCGELLRRRPVTSINPSAETAPMSKTPPATDVPTMAPLVESKHLQLHSSAGHGSALLNGSWTYQKTRVRCCGCD